MSRPRPHDDGPSIDWSGRAESADGSDGQDDRGSTSEGPTGRRRLAILAGIVSSLYIVFVIADLVLLQFNALIYTTVHEGLRDLGPRLVLVGAWLALLYHGLDGLRVVVADFRPGLRSKDRALRGVVAFTVFAVWIPTSLILLWPAIRGWFAP